MTPLRQKMIRELELQRKSPNTVEAYVRAVAGLASHYHRSPDQIELEEVRSYLHYLITTTMRYLHVSEVCLTSRKRPLNLLRLPRAEDFRQE